MHIKPIFGVFGIGLGEIIAIMAALVVFVLMTGGIIALVIWLSRRGKAAPLPAPPVIPPPTKRACPQCGTELAGDAPQGLCPKCLMKAAFESQAAPPGQSPKEPSPALSVDEIRKAFPLLEIIELLGQGGMGMVYKARQAQLDRLVALKILSPSLSNDPAFAERFLREAKALAHLNHPNIVSVYDFGQAGEFYFLTMEFVDGMNLWQLEQSKKRLTPEEALAIIPKICDALQYAHDEGIVHRDIKPANILVDKKGRVKIADFGLAKLLGTEPKGLGLTQTKMTMGTPQYMAPEQLEKPLTVDHRADIFSLGVVFYEMLTGELPLGRFAPPSRKVQMDVRLDEVVMRALEKEPELRYQQASQIRTDVETIVSDPQKNIPLTASPAPAQTIRSTPPAICSGVITGAMWGLIGVLYAAIWFAGKMSWGESLGALTLFRRLTWPINIPLTLFSVAAPFGMTLLGWMAVGQIRQSKGKLTGLGLAIFEALLFPWLLVTGVVVFGWYLVLMLLKQSPLLPYWMKSEAGIMALWIIGIMVLVLIMFVAGIFAARWLWKTNHPTMKPKLISPRPSSGRSETVNKTPSSGRIKWHRWLTATAVIVLLVVLTRAFVLAPYWAAGSSVSPEIPGESYVVVFKLARNFQPGEIIAYNTPNHVFLARVTTGSSADAVRIKRSNGSEENIPRSEVIGRVIFNTRASVPLTDEPKPAVEVSQTNKPIPRQAEVTNISVSQPTTNTVSSIHKPFIMAAKIKPKTAAELKTYMVGTVWTISNNKPDEKPGYTLMFLGDGMFVHSDGRSGDWSASSAHDFKMWNYDPAVLNDDCTAFRAVGNNIIYFGKLLRQCTAEDYSGANLPLIQAAALRPKTKPKTTKELRAYLLGTVWDQSSDQTDGTIHHTIAFLKNGNFLHSKGMIGHWKVVSPQDMQLWNDDTVRFSADYTEFRAVGAHQVYFGFLKNQKPGIKEIILNAGMMPAKTNLLRSITDSNAVGLNLDNGTETSLTEEQHQISEDHLVDYAAKHGVSLMGYRHDDSWDLWSSAKLSSANEGLWLNGTHADIRAVLDSTNVELPKNQEMGIAGFKSYGLRPKSGETKTAAFQTVTGRIGLMQITCPTNQPENLKIAWKFGP